MAPRKGDKTTPFHPHCYWQKSHETLGVWWRGLLWILDVSLCFHGDAHRGGRWGGAKSRPRPRNVRWTCSLGSHGAAPSSRRAGSAPPGWHTPWNVNLLKSPFPVLQPKTVSQGPWNCSLEVYHQGIGSPVAQSLRGKESKFYGSDWRAHGLITEKTVQTQEKLNVLYIFHWSTSS